MYSDTLELVFYFAPVMSIKFVNALENTSNFLSPRLCRAHNNCMLVRHDLQRHAVHIFIASATYYRTAARIFAKLDNVLVNKISFWRAGEANILPCSFTTLNKVSRFALSFCDVISYQICHEVYMPSLFRTSNPLQQCAFIELGCRISDVPNN